jgi:hypothetical protein
MASRVLALYGGRDGQDDALPSASRALVVVATPAEFAAVGTTASHPGPDEWTYRRFVLPYASLAAHAGGVGAFMSCAEMVALSRVRLDAASYPFVAALKTIAVDASGMPRSDFVVSICCQIAFILRGIG